MTSVSRREFIAGGRLVHRLVESVPAREDAHSQVPPRPARDERTMVADDEGRHHCRTVCSALLARCEAAKGLNAFITIEPGVMRRRAMPIDGIRARFGPLRPADSDWDSINTRIFLRAAALGARAFRAKADAPS